MAKNIPLWYRLIHYWCRERIPKGYGLTLPFIIGAMNDSSISQLLSEIRNSSLEEKIILRKCDDLDEYVLALDEQAAPISLYLSGDKALLYNDSQIELLSSFQEVVGFMESIYNKHIAAKTYSKNIKTQSWEQYSSNDIEMIKAICSKQQ